MATHLGKLRNVLLNEVFGWSYNLFLANKQDLSHPVYPGICHNIPYKLMICYTRARNVDMRYPHMLCMHQTDILKIDWDNVSLEDVTNEIDLLLTVDPTLNFRVYKTKNGYHAFVISRKIKHNSDEMLKIADRASKSDMQYSALSYYDEYSMRFTSKAEANMEQVATCQPAVDWICDRGSTIVNSDIVGFLNFYERLCYYGSTLNPRWILSLPELEIKTMSDEKIGALIDEHSLMRLKLGDFGTNTAFVPYDPIMRHVYRTVDLNTLPSSDTLSAGMQNSLGVVIGSVVRRTTSLDDVFYRKNNVSTHVTWSIPKTEPSQPLMISLRTDNVAKFDWDNVSLSEIMVELKTYCDNHPEALFSLYRTTNGYHAFLLSQPLHHRDPMFLQLTDKLKADTHYASFAWFKQYTYRVSRKAGRTVHRDHVLMLVTNIGTGNANPEISRFMRLYEAVMDWGRGLAIDWNSAIKPRYTYDITGKSALAELSNLNTGIDLKAILNDYYLASVNNETVDEKKDDNAVLSLPDLTAITVDHMKVAMASYISEGKKLTMDEFKDALMANIDVSTLPIVCEDLSILPPPAARSPHITKMWQQIYQIYRFGTQIKSIPIAEDSQHTRLILCYDETARLPHMIALHHPSIFKVDWDFISLPDLRRLIPMFCAKFSSLGDHLFRIYKTWKGYHGILVSRRVPHNSDEMMTMSEHLNCDPPNAGHMYYEGYSFRLTRKLARYSHEQTVVQYVETLGTGVEDPEIMAWLTDYEAKCVKGEALPIDWNNGLLLQDMSTDQWRERSAELVSYFKTVEWNKL
jgi:hypothetical protein